MSYHFQQNFQKPSFTHIFLYCVCPLFFFCKLTYADEFDSLQYSASANHAWDSNLFRSSNNETSDQITTYKAGVRFDKKYSLQHFVIDVNYVDYKYQKSDFLNFDAINYSAAWQWALSPALTGTISTRKNKSLLGFADFRTLIQNIRTDEYNIFRAEYSPYKVWSLIVGFTDTSLKNSQTFNAQNDYDATAFDYGVRYNFVSGTSFTMLGHKRNGNFKRSLNASNIALSFDNGFNEDEFEVDVLFKASAKSNLSSKLAYLSREYDNFSVRDYDAWLGNLKYDLLLTGKLKTSMDLSRAVGTFETQYSTYSITDAVNIGATYFYSDKVILGLNARLSQRDFDGRVNPAFPNRVDHEQSINGALTWQPLRNIGLTLSSIKSSRNANSGYDAFDFDDVTTSVTVDLKI
ncbi:XrtB/PEP-CTERM-associated polysaccharide biosynthesis outer membrane protein EpsL [Methylophilus aquaticus]|uniref:Exopolysaccharide biosynthesis operon protein EpsL n=1 Tax=Methylophilus aquaticus TaxID=1971610 RepID=A0ABT9JT82_9PROT|nr:XrtB/PEP-CTERM-associated polysaccharide biosynthesis outer membrane protein EpsL [Methylophilus aquaticus]MDP8567773.1 hypothetical protein [Methylophilus aquaticus]